MTLFDELLAVKNRIEQNANLEPISEKGESDLMERLLAKQHDNHELLEDKP